MDYLILTYKLKKEVSRDEFFEFSRKTDQPLVKKQPGVNRFEVYATDLLDSDDLDVDIIEIIVLDNAEQWQEIQKTTEMQENAKIWKKYGNEESVKSYKCSLIE